MGPFYLVSMPGEVSICKKKYIDFLNKTFFYYVLLSRILSGLAIYQQNDLTFSGLSYALTLSVHKNMILWFHNYSG